MIHLKASKNLILCLLLTTAVGVGTAVAQEGHEKDKNAKKNQPTVEEQIHGLEQMCTASAEARAKRHEEKSLYERLGKDEKIHELTKEVVRLHLENENLDRVMGMTEDYDLLAKRVAQFMISGMGGPVVYKDRPTLTASHEHLKLTDADFLAAGGDVIQAMKNLGYGQNEIDEVVCALVGLREQVILKDIKEARKAKQGENSDSK